MDLRRGSCEEILAGLDADSVDSIVTDPPYGLKFMGKSWDYDLPSIEIWKEIFRVLKPGGHLLSFGGTRTYHRMASRVEDAGFEIRDQLQWLFGQGFPKSLNLGNGWGTALKPANEPILLARKPLSEKTVAANVLRWGTGGINVDASRIPGIKAAAVYTDFKKSRKDTVGFGYVGNCSKGEKKNDVTEGRFPSNILLDEQAAQMLDEQSGVLKSGRKNGPMGKMGYHGAKGNIEIRESSEGGASRFFYVAKASTRERNAGVEKNTHPTVKPVKLMEYLVRLITPPNGLVLDPFMGSGTTGIAAKNLGFHFLGIEKDPSYMEIARARIIPG